MSKLFYKPLAQYKYTESNDPRGFHPLPTDCFGEIEYKVWMAKYMRLNNKTNHLFKVRCNDYLNGGRI